MWGHRICKAFAGLWDKQSETIKDEIREPMTILRDMDSTCIYHMGIKSELVHTKGRQRGVVNRRMEGRVGREVGQDLQVDLGPRDGLETKGRPTRLLEEKFITRELNQYGGYEAQYGGCHSTSGNKRHFPQCWPVLEARPPCADTSTSSATRNDSAEGVGGCGRICVGRRVAFGLS